MSNVVIFLDIDGVLVTSRTFCANMDSVHQFDPIGCGMIRRLCEEFSAKIVISSTWRFCSDIKQHHTAGAEDSIKNRLYFNLLNGKLLEFVHDDWKTIDIHRFNAGKVRGDEIAEWLSRHSEVTNYVIVDDDLDMLGDQLDHFVHTKGVDGISYENYHSLKTILSSL